MSRMLLINLSTLIPLLLGWKTLPALSFQIPASSVFASYYEYQLQQPHRATRSGNHHISRRRTFPSTSPFNRQRQTKLLLRNFDLPETLIFYGLDTILDTKNYQICDYDDDDGDSTDIFSNGGEESKTKADSQLLVETFINSKQKLEVRPGVLRLMKESQEINTPMIVLSEHLAMEQIQSMIALTDECKEFEGLLNDNILHFRSSLEEYKVDYTKLQDEREKDDDDAEYDDLEYEYPSTFLGQGIGYAPSPATLMDAIHSIFIEPRGFGGSSGFGVKYADAVRNPLPQHCVVFVSKSSDGNPISRRSNCDDLFGSSSHERSVSRDRCIASRTAGMRVMYLEDGCLGSCTAEDVSDGIIDTLGTENDWEMVTMDDISTPGSFWLNMAQPKDESGNRVNAFDVVDYYRKLRTKSEDDVETDVQSSQDSNHAMQMEAEELDEDEIQKILADLDPL